MKLVPLSIAVAAIGSLASGCGSPALRQPQRPVLSSTTAIVGANLWDGTGRALVANSVTLVRGDRVICAGTAEECPAPAGARVIDAKGQYLIPGLIDSHVHLLFLINGSAGGELALDLRDLLAQGVTTVRDMGTDPAELLARVRSMPAAPRVYAMQLVAGRRFFFNGFRGVATARGTVYRQPPALTMQRLGWKPIQFNPADNPDSVVDEAIRAGAMGLKLYAQLDSLSVQRLTEAAHRAGMPVWGHAWVQPASVLEQARAGQDGVVHAAGFAGELFSVEERDTLVNDGDLQTATATAGPSPPRTILGSPRPSTTWPRRARSSSQPSMPCVTASPTSTRSCATCLRIQEDYARAAAQFGVEVTREAVRRGVRISAGSDHVAYGPVGERASLFGELQLLVDSIALSPTAALLAATRDAALAIGGEPARLIGTIAARSLRRSRVSEQEPTGADREFGISRAGDA